MPFEFFFLSVYPVVYGSRVVGEDHDKVFSGLAYSVCV